MYDRGCGAGGLTTPTFWYPLSEVADTTYNFITNKLILQNAYTNIVCWDSDSSATNDWNDSTFWIWVLNLCLSIMTFPQSVADFSKFFSALRSSCAILLRLERFHLRSARREHRKKISPFKSLLFLPNSRRCTLWFCPLWAAAINIPTSWAKCSLARHYPRSSVVRVFWETRWCGFSLLLAPCSFQTRPLLDESIYSTNWWKCAHPSYETNLHYTPTYQRHTFTRSLNSNVFHLCIRWSVWILYIGVIHQSMELE